MNKTYAFSRLVNATRRQLLVALGAASLAPAAWAQPDLSRQLGPTIADTGSASYRFSRFDLRSADGQRGYRVVLGIPRGAAPAEGYPAIVLLDGNAALASMDEALLQSLQAGQPPVLIAVGYDTELRFDVAARAFDYTPPLAAGQVDEEAARGRHGGGTEVFSALHDREILPRARAMVALDAARMAIWGHSYGGLFVLHTLFTRAQSFSRYIAASPSLWWGQGAILREEAQFQPTPSALAGRQLWVMTGDAERRERPAPADGAQRAAIDARAAMPPTALPDLLARLQLRPGLQVQAKVFPGLAHGPMLPASLGPALRLAAGLPPFA